MDNTKEFLTTYLKESGADAATVSKFEEVFDKDVRKAVEGEVDAMQKKELENRTQASKRMMEIAEEANIRKRYY